MSITVTPAGDVRIDGALAGTPADAAANWPDLADEIEAAATEWRAEQRPPGPVPED